MKTEIILREDGSIFKEVDYIENLQLKLSIIKGEITEQLYYKNKFGGKDIIDEYGCSNYDSFKDTLTLLREIVKAQITKRLRKNK